MSLYEDTADFKIQSEIRQGDVKFNKIVHYIIVWALTSEPMVQILTGRNYII